MKVVRILHILHSMNRGGAENALMNYYRHIDREKVQFDFLLTDNQRTLFEDEIITLGGRVYKVPALKMTNPFPYLKSVYTFLKSHPEYKIIHSHTSSKSVFPLGIARLCGVPIRCSHSHSSSSEKGLKGLIRNLLMPLLKVTATDFIACGENAAIWLYGARFCKRGKVRIFKNVIETEKFRLNLEIRKDIRMTMGVDDDTLVIGHTARFSSVKNHLFDLDILSCLKRRNIKAKLLLVGGGELEEQIRQRATELNVLSDVIFVGIVSNVWDYEQTMDVFLLPSFYEGLPLSIIEAQVSGLPCFTTAGRVSYECGITDVVSFLDLEAGADVWAESILLKCTQERRDRSGEIIAAGYDASVSAKQLMNFYIGKYNNLKNESSNTSSWLG